MVIVVAPQMIRSVSITIHKVCLSYKSSVSYFLDLYQILSSKTTKFLKPILGRKGGVAPGVSGEQGPRRTVRLQGREPCQGMLPVSFLVME